MEPKPTFRWESYGRLRYILRPNGDHYDGYQIVIYKPYGNANKPWVAVSDYESDYTTMIGRDDDLAALKAQAERHWFQRYHEDRFG